MVKDAPTAPSESEILAPTPPSLHHLPSTFHAGGVVNVDIVVIDMCLVDLMAG